jgi:hypothetical protein
LLAFKKTNIENPSGNAVATVGVKYSLVDGGFVGVGPKVADAITKIELVNFSPCRTIRFESIG